MLVSKQWSELKNSDHITVARKKRPTQPAQLVINQYS